MQRAERFSGRLGSWLAMLGVAIGLGNVWRFPYMMGAHGGSAFLLIYMGLTLLFAIPMLAAEYALGRHTRSGVLDSYCAALGPRLGRFLGLVLVFSILVADSYYTVVIGNIGYTTLVSAWNGFSDANMSAFQSGLGNGHLQYTFSLAMLGAALFVLWRGVNRGIESASRWFVPAFGVIVLYLVGYATTLDGAAGRVAGFLSPDFSAIGIRDVFAALGQSFFSLSVGGTFMVVYGNCLPDDADLPVTAIMTAAGDVGAALFAALFLVPTILYFGLDMAAGPTLIFHTLPMLFAAMPGGRLLGTLFLVALNLMAFLSAVAGFEVCLSGLADFSRGRIDRNRALLIVGALEVILMWPSAHSPSLIGTLDLVFGSALQIVGAIVAVVALTWGLGRDVALHQIWRGRNTAGTRAAVWWLRWVVPVILLVILGLYVADSLGKGSV